MASDPSVRNGQLKKIQCRCCEGLCFALGLLGFGFALCQLSCHGMLYASAGKPLTCWFASHAFGWHCWCPFNSFFFKLEVAKYFRGPLQAQNERRTKDNQQSLQIPVTQQPWSPQMKSQEIQKHQPDILGLCEVDRFDDLEVNLADDGYEGTYKRKRTLPSPPAATSQYMSGNVWTIREMHQQSLQKVQCTCVYVCMYVMYVCNVMQCNVT